MRPCLFWHAHSLSACAETPGWKRRLRLLSWVKQNVYKWVSFLFFFFFGIHQTACQRPVTDAALVVVHPTLRGFLFCFVFLSFICSFSFVMGQHGHGYKCTSNICLRICRGHCSHSSEVSVCRGPPGGPIPESPVRTFSHLSTCEILHTSHNWSMTVSAKCIRCFFYMLFTQIIWIIVSVEFFGASFF